MFRDESPEIGCHRGEARLIAIAVAFEGGKVVCSALRVTGEMVGDRIKVEGQRVFNADRGIAADLQETGAGVEEFHAGGRAGGDAGLVKPIEDLIDRA